MLITKKLWVAIMKRERVREKVQKSKKTLLQKNQVIFTVVTFNLPHSCTMYSHSCTMYYNFTENGGVNNDLLLVQLHCLNSFPSQISYEYNNNQTRSATCSVNSHCHNQSRKV